MSNVLFVSLLKHTSSILCFTSVHSKENEKQKKKNNKNNWHRFVRHQAVCCSSYSLIVSERPFIFIVPWIFFYLHMLFFFGCCWSCFGLISFSLHLSLCFIPLLIVCLWYRQIFDHSHPTTTTRGLPKASYFYFIHILNIIHISVHNKR